MRRLPVVSGHEVISALEKAGYSRLRQSGSHVSVGRKNPVIVITVPLHREVAKGTLRAILRDAGLTAEQFINLLH